MTQLEGILARLDVADCWLWTGSRNQSGYGKVSTGNTTRAVHRLLYELLVGPVARHLDLDHLCRQRLCCNPDHLEPVSRQANVDRGSRRAGILRVSACRAGHPYTEGNTKKAGRHRRCRTCAQEANRLYRQRVRVRAA